MKLFTKEINNKLFAQYPKGGNLEDQMVVAKLFNPYGRGTWYLINSDPNEPDYIWAIVDLMDVEVGSVSRTFGGFKRCGCGPCITGPADYSSFSGYRGG